MVEHAAKIINVCSDKSCPVKIVGKLIHVEFPIILYSYQETKI